MQKSDGPRGPRGTAHAVRSASRRSVWPVDAPLSPIRAHEALDRAAGNMLLTVPVGNQGPVQHDVHLAGPERRVLLRVESADLLLEDLIAPRLR